MKKNIWTAAWNDDGSWVGVDCGDAADPHCAEVCTVCLESIETDDEAEAFALAKADAHLIAAAPDLLAALEALRIGCLCTAACWSQAYIDAEAAIAKAKGGAS